METGGLMSGIRSLTVEEVRKYHKAYYRSAPALTTPHPSQNPKP
jgi:Zn-dependent M16 (insulinase) family peptidase